MKIAVCIKQVPDSGTVSLDPEKHTLVRSSVGVALNPLDEFPLELAMQFKDQIGAEITALSMGPPRAEEVLARAIAMGADQGVLLTDRFFAGGDTWATSTVLSTALKHCGPFDLILFGKMAIDGDTAQVGPETATMLDLPQAAGVCKIEIPKGKKPKELLVHRMFEDGKDQVMMPLPSVLMVLKEAGEPRFGTLQGRISYYQQGVTKLTAADLELEPELIGLKGSPTRVVKTSVPVIEREQQKIEGSPEEQAAKLAEIFAEKDLIAAQKK